MLEKQQKRYRRHRRVRAKIFGTAKLPRLCVFRSAKHIYVQIINDEKGETILSSNDLELKKLKISPSPKLRRESKIQEPKTIKKEREKISRIGKIAVAFGVGKLIARKALEKKIEKVVFDRGGFKYHGAVKAVAEGAREGGLKF